MEPVFECCKIVPVMNTADYTTGLAGDSINMSGYHRATFIVTLDGTVAGANGVIQLFSGATNGAETTALTPRYAWGGAAIGTAVAGSTASSDVLAAIATAATTGVVVGDTAHDSFMCVIDILASEMASTHKWLTIKPNGGTAGGCHIVAILEPRYSGASANIPTALA